MSPQTRDILTNRDVIAIDQDTAAAPARPTGGDARILVKPLSDGAAAVAYVNTADAPATMGSTAEAAGLPKTPCSAGATPVTSVVWLGCVIVGRMPVTPST